MDWLAGTPKDTFTRFEDVRPGRVAVQGRIRSAEPVSAPIGGALCAGYYYKCTHKVSSRLKGYIRRKLSDALVYAPSLTLEMEGGNLALVALRSDRWGPERHRVLLAEDYLEFKATEQTIPQGAQVRVVGKVTKGPGGELRLQFSELYRSDEEKGSKSKRAAARKGFRRGPRRARSKRK